MQKIGFSWSNRDKAYTIVLEAILFYFILFYFIVCCVFVFSRAGPVACGGSQARGPIKPVAAALCYSHCNMGSELRL